MIKLIDILKEIIIQEHYLGLEYPSGEDWDKTTAVAKDYLKNKGVDDRTINYWTRPETEEDHQENIHIPFVYNDAILNKVNFNFKFIPDFNASEVKLDSNVERERENKFKKTLETGTEFFKGIPVKGDTQKERKKYILDTTKEFLEGNESLPVTIIDKDGEQIVADGAHRIWIAKKLGIPLKAYIVIPTPKLT
jgi:hypothetical protein